MYIAMEPFTATGISIVGILQSLQAIVGLAKNINTVEFNGKLIELQSFIFDQQNKLMQLQADNDALNREKRELKEALAVKGAAHLEAGVYWTSKEGKQDGPFCLTCYDVDGKLVRPIFRTHIPANGTKEAKSFFYCRIHETAYALPVKLLKERGVFIGDVDE